MNAWAQSSKATSYIIRAVIYVIVGVGFTFAEYVWHIWSEKPCDPPDLSIESALVTRKFYTYLTTMDWRKPENRHATVVAVREDREPKELFESFCLHREFLGKLIKEIGSHDPISIVVDNYISDNTCPADQQLKQTLTDIRVPVIIGQHTLNKKELEHFLGRSLAPAELKSFGRACLVMHDNLNLGLPAGHVSYGSIRFNADSRKLPLSWPVFTSPANISDQDATTDMKTLAAQAAFTVPGVKVPDLETHPYTSFLRQDEINVLSAIKVLCANDSSGSDWRNCAGSGAQFDSALRHHVVFIGDDTDDDQHDTPAGTMPGVFVHANYLESLVGKRFFSPIKERWQVICGILWLAFIELAYVKTRNPLIGLAVSFGGTALLWVSCAVFAILTGILPVIWVPGALALLLRFGEGIRERLMESK
jgi:hypothetical protein